MERVDREGTGAACWGISRLLILRQQNIMNEMHFFLCPLALPSKIHMALPFLLSSLPTSSPTIFQSQLFIPLFFPISLSLPLQESPLAQEASLTTFILTHSVSRGKRRRNKEGLPSLFLLIQIAVDGRHWIFSSFFLLFLV